MKKLISFFLLFLFVAGGLVSPITAEAKVKLRKKPAVHSVRLAYKRKAPKKARVASKPVYYGKHWWTRLPASGKRTRLLSPKQRRMAEDREAAEEARERQVLAAQGVGLSTSKPEASPVSQAVSSNIQPPKNDVTPVNQVISSNVVNPTIPSVNLPGA